MKKIVTFGEVLLRLTTPGNLRFSQTRDYVATFGGSETNVAVSLANFCIPTEFVTRLPDNEIARACVGNLRSHGLRTDGIIYGGDRMGIYFLENGASFRNSKVVYDRAGSSFSTLRPGMARCLKGLDKTDCSLLLPDSTSPSTSTRHLPSAGSHFSFSPGAVWQTFDAIKEVNRPEEIDWRTIPSMQTIAWKTGTSYGFRDAWAVGVTPRYAVGVWVGNATGEGKPGLVGARTAGPVLFDVFNLLPSSQWFDRPSGVFTDAEVCRLSGHLKGRFCEETDTIPILPAGLKTEACPYHHLINLSADGTSRIYESCIGMEPIIQKSWFTLPPVWEWYYKQHHPEYKLLPPFKPGCGEDMLRPMQFVYPTMNARVFLPKQLDGSKGQLNVELVHNNPKATVYWHLDNNYLSETQDFHKLSFLPSPGKHSLTAVDNEGNTVSVTFFVE
jgi:penicillin-binding protein 1C